MERNIPIYLSEDCLTEPPIQGELKMEIPEAGEDQFIKKLIVFYTNNISIS